MIISNTWSSGWDGGVQFCCFCYWASLTMTFSCFIILDLGLMLGFDNPWGSWGVWVENMFLYMDFLMLLPGALEFSQHLRTPSSFCWLARPSELCKRKPKCVGFSGESFSSLVRAMANKNNGPCSLSLLEVDFFFFFFKLAHYWLKCFEGLDSLWGISTPIPFQLSQAQSLVSWPPDGSMVLF